MLPDAGSCFGVNRGMGYPPIKEMSTATEKVKELVKSIQEVYNSK